MPAWYALAQQAAKMGLTPWALEREIAADPHAAWWLRRLQGAWALEADPTIQRMRDT